MFNNQYTPFYNPQPRYQPMDQYAQQPQQNNMLFNAVQSRSVLNGKQVDSVDVVKAMDIPLDGSISYFPLTDGSAIVSKQLQMDGTSKMVVYRPTDDENQSVKFVTQDDLEKSLKNIDLSDIDDLKDEFKELKSEIKEIQKKLKSKGE